MAELLDELREHWSDGYWWADRQLLLAVVLGVIGGLLSLVFKYAELHMARAMAVDS